MWIAIEGVVGAGKTTTASLLGERAGLRTAVEQIEDHPFLESYYREPARYTLETELMFMLLHLREMQAVSGAEGVITDFAPAKNLIFAGLGAEPEELSLLERVDARLWRDMPRPDLAIFLDPPLDVCLSRITARGRSYERDLDISALARIRHAYLQRLDRLGAEVPRLELTGNENPSEVVTAAMRLADIDR